MKLGRHSNPSNKKGALRQGKSRSQANVAGYEKRLARKAKSTPTTDLYEHIPDKTRRSKVALDLGRDEEFEFPNAWDGPADDEEREELRARLIGENEDDEEIASNDDEEIDSDAAFEESDEERFADFFSNKKTKSANKSADDFEPSDDFGPSDDEEMPETLDRLKTESAKKLMHESAEDFEPSDDEETPETLEIFEPSDDEEMPEALNQLNDFVSNLDVTSKKRKATEAVGLASTDTRPRKRQLLNERTEAGAENEFRAHSSGLKLNLDDLLAPLASQSAALQSLKSSAKVLTSSSSKAKTLSAPLPQRTQERLDRQAAYEQTKEEVDKWSETMKHIREAEHLSFPLQSQPASHISNLELTAKFKPTTPLESAVDALLKSAKLRDEDIHHTEDAMLQMNQLSVEEVAQRRGELRKMRELMFRAEVKARRVGKIKSKTYRRIKRKEKERLNEKTNEDDSQDEEGILKKELERARERATLRHKHTGKWARQMRNKEGLDADSRRDIEDMLARGEKQRRRIKGIGSDESEDGSEDQDDDGDDGLDAEGGLEKIKQGAFDELRKLDEAEKVEGEKGKSVFEMKFMKDAMARQMQATNKTVDDFIKEMGGNTGTGDSDDEAQENESQALDSSSGVLVQRTGGRVTYRPSETTHHPSSTQPLAASDTSSVTLKSTDLLSPPPPSPTIPIRQSALSLPSTLTPKLNSNPWLTRTTEAVVKLTKKTNEVVVQKGSNALDKSKNKLKKQTRKREEREKAKEDGVVEISLDTALTLPSGPSGSSPPEATIRKANQQAPAVHADEEDSDNNSEVEAQEMALTLKGKGRANGIKAFEQRDLVALAFAGDNVVQSFEEAKSREIASDAPREVDTTIPGWGSWGGAGTKKLPPKPQRIKKIAGIDPTTRADFNKKHVIISEKRDKKAGKYLAKDLPYPYTSKAQFERAMGNPLGSEWNTRVAFQRGTLPKVVKKPGVIINPLEKLTS